MSNESEDEPTTSTTVTTHIVVDGKHGRREHRHVQVIPDSMQGGAVAAISENAALAILNFYGPLALADVSQRMQRPLVSLAKFFEAPVHDESGYDPEFFDDDEDEDED